MERLDIPLDGTSPKKIKPHGFYFSGLVSRADDKSLYEESTSHVSLGKAKSVMHRDKKSSRSFM